MTRFIRSMVLCLVVLSIHEFALSAETNPTRRARSLFGIKTEIGSLGLTFSNAHSSVTSFGLSFDYLASPRNTIGGYISYQIYKTLETPDFTLSASAVELSMNAKYYPIHTLRDSLIAPYICGATSLIIGTQEATFTSSTSGDIPKSTMLFLQTLSPSIGVMFPLGKNWYFNVEAKFTFGYGIGREVTDTDIGKALYSDISYTFLTQLSGTGGLCVFF